MINLKLYFKNQKKKKPQIRKIKIKTEINKNETEKPTK